MSKKDSDRPVVGNEWVNLLLLVLAVIFLLKSWSYVKDHFVLDDDCEVEEFLECFIEKEFNFPEGSIDLTPESPE